MMDHFNPSNQKHDHHNDCRCLSTKTLLGHSAKHKVRREFFQAFLANQLFRIAFVERMVQFKMTDETSGHLECCGAITRSFACRYLTWTAGSISA